MNGLEERCHWCAVILLAALVAVAIMLIVGAALCVVLLAFLAFGAIGGFTAVVFLLITAVAAVWIEQAQG